MQFNSFVFLITFAIAVITYYLIPLKFRNYFLVICNYLFYSYFDYRLSLLLLSLTTFTYFIGTGIFTSNSEKNKKYLFIIGIVGNLAALGFFKYYNFFIQQINSTLSIFIPSLNLSTLNIILPLGISFYVFQTLTYIFDNYYETLEEKYNFIQYTAFASFFPTIIAGPIEKASKLLPQIKNGINFQYDNIQKGLALITVGMFRKVLIGDTCGSIVDQVFAEPKYYLSPEVLITLFLYTFQLYNDFAGYSSIARGIARILGFEITSNFRQPYFSQSISEFWKRWHISLAIWLRDYLFKPLQFKYRSLGKYGNVLGIMITFVLCGLWHGPSWGYIFWGFSQGFYISYSFLTIDYREKLIKLLRIPAFVVKAFRILFTFNLITLTFLFFRADSFSTAFEMLSIIFNWTASQLTMKFFLALLAVSIFSFSFDLLELKYKSQAFLLKMKPPLKYGISIGFWIVIVLYLLTANKLPFIYAQF